MTGKHYQWHKRWQVDLSTCTATHDSGLIIRFVQDPSLSYWDGHPVNSEEWLSKIKNKMSSQDLANHAARLMREAGDAYLWHLNRRH